MEQYKVAYTYDANEDVFDRTYFANSTREALAAFYEDMNPFVRVVDVYEYKTPYHYGIVFGGDSEDEVYEYYFDTLHKMCYDLAHTIAFSDCSDATYTEAYAGDDCITYGGWMPGMRYKFFNNTTGECVFDCSFPNWDH